MHVSSHIRQPNSKQSVEYPIRVTDHAIEKIREIGIDSQHSDGWVRDKIAVQVWNQIKEAEPGKCPQLGGRADFIVELVPDMILGLKVKSHAVVVKNERPGDDNAKWAVTTILDEASFNARKEMAAHMQEDPLNSVRQEIIDTMHKNLAESEVLVVLLDVAGTFMGLRGFANRSDAERYINTELADGASLDGFRVLEELPLKTKVSIG